MKRFLVLCLMFACFYGMSTAQHSVATVFLKDGSIIKGQLISFDPEKGLQIKSGENTLNYSHHDIEKVDFGTVEAPKSGITQNTPDGFYNKTTLGALFGSSDSQYKAPFTITSSVGYHVLPKLGLGVGAGLEFYDQALVPVFGEANYFITKGSVVPYITLHGGWAFAIDDRSDTFNETFDSKGGVRAGGGVGCYLKLNSGIGFVLEGAYQFQEVKVHKTSQFVQYNSTLIDQYQRFAVRLGFYF